MSPVKHLPLSGTAARARGLAACAFLAAAPALAQNVLIDTYMQVAPGGTYSLPATSSLTITPTGELNAPFGSVGSAISLAGDVLNQGKLRAGFGSELRGLHLSGGVTTNQRVGLIEADSLGLSGTGRLFNSGQLLTGSYTMPFSSPNGATVLTIPSLGGLFSSTGTTINNFFKWISNANVTVGGTFNNDGTFISENNPQFFLDNAVAAPYAQSITLPATPVGGTQAAIYNKPGAFFSIGAGTTLFNNALVSNAGVMLVNGRVENQALLGSNVFPNPDAFLNLSSGELRIGQTGDFNVGPRHFAGDNFVNEGLIKVGGSFYSVPAVQNKGTIFIAGGVMNASLVNEATHTVQVDRFLFSNFIENAGNINVQSGGTLTINRSLFNQGGGLLRVAGNGAVLGHSDIQNDGDITIEASGRLEATNMLHAAGTLTVDGTLDMFGGLLMMTGGVLNGNGSLKGSARINGVPFTNGGVGVAVFQPGHSPGHMDITGALTFGRGGVLELDVQRDFDGMLHWDTVSAASIDFEPGSVIDVLIFDNAPDLALPSLSLNFLTCTQAASCNFGRARLEVFGADFSPFQDARFVVGANGLSFALAPVPEPEAWALLLAGLGLLSLVRRHGGKS